MHSLLLFVSFVTSCLAEKATFPQNIELDLIFPRNNTIYAPTTQFPIIFAIQNAAIGWPYDLAIDWSLTSASPVGSEYTWNDGTFNSSTETLPLPEPFLFIASGNKTNVADQFTLDWAFTINNASTNPRDLYPFSYPMGNHTIVTIPNTVYFSIAKGGIAPDVVVDGKCPEGVGMFVVESIATTDSGTYPIVNPTAYGASDPQDGSYPITQPLYTPPEFNPCAVKVDTALASSVSAVLASQTSLPSGAK